MSETASLSNVSRYEQACDQAIAMCDGNMRSTIKALIMANEYLEAELQELHAAPSATRGAINGAALGKTPPKAGGPSGSKIMADVTYYVALPFLQDDSGSPVAGT